MSLRNVLKYNADVPTGRKGRDFMEHFVPLRICYYATTCPELASGFKITIGIKTDFSKWKC